MSLPTEQQHADALLALLADIGVGVYEVDKVAAMSSAPQEYVEVELEWRYGPAIRQAARRSTDGYRFTTYAIGRSVHNVRNSLSRVAAAVDGQRVTVGGYVSTPIQRETSDAPREQEGRFVGYATWTYVL